MFPRRAHEDEGEDLEEPDGRVVDTDHVLVLTDATEVGHQVGEGGAVGGGQLLQEQLQPCLALLVVWHFYNHRGGVK